MIDMLMEHQLVPTGPMLLLYLAYNFFLNLLFILVIQSDIFFFFFLNVIDFY